MAAPSERFNESAPTIINGFLASLNFCPKPELFPSKSFNTAGFSPKCV